MPDPRYTHPLSLRVTVPLQRAVVFGLFMTFGSLLRVRGWRSVPRNGPLIVLSNHLSNTDPVIVQYSSPRLINFMARRDLFRLPVIGWLTNWWRAFPVTQSSPDREALKRAIHLLEKGHAVGVFPEGRLSPDGRLLPLSRGVALLVRRTGATCVCVGLRGTEGVMPYPKMTPQWSGRPTSVQWGLPRTFEPGATDDEILGWVEGELRSLSNAPPD